MLNRLSEFSLRLKAKVARIKVKTKKVRKTINFPKLSLYRKKTFFWENCCRLYAINGKLEAKVTSLK